MTQTGTTRRQLTLFVPAGAAPEVEALRARVDPVQFGLIAAHVTLCREDELADLHVTELTRNLAHAAPAPLTLHFGPARRFAEHGMLLPCVDGAAAFHRLREAVLGATDIPVREAHLTLAHPRNPRAPANVDASFASLPSLLAVTFADIALIEQHDAQPWVVLATFPLEGATILHAREPVLPP